MSPARAIPSGRVARGSLRPPSSKSLTHRYLNLALLAGDRRTLVEPLVAEDTRLFAAALERFGWTVERAADRLALTPPASAAPEGARIHCGNAGTMARFLVATACVLPGRWRIDGVARLRERPVAPLVTALRHLGAAIEPAGEEGYLPLVIDGRRGLDGGRTRLDAGASSQYLSALLMAAHRARGPVEIEVERLTSAPYVEITLAALERFGGSVERTGPTAAGPAVFRLRPRPLAGPARLRVEADFSAACYPAAAAVLTGGEVTLSGLAEGSPQGDRHFLDLLTAMGAAVEWSAGEGGDGGEAVTIRGGGRLEAVDADLGPMPDQVPTLAALAPFAHGTTRIRGVPHLRIKESDRLRAMASGLGRLGVPVEERPDGLVVPGVWAEQAPPGDAVTVDSFDDHRIAMSFALVGLRRPGVRVDRPQVVAKSYPGFWDDLERLLGGA